MKNVKKYYSKLIKNHYLKLVMGSGLYLEYVRDFNIDFEIGSIRRRDHPFVPGLNVIMGKGLRKYLQLVEFLSYGKLNRALSWTLEKFLDYSGPS